MAYTEIVKHPYYITSHEVPSGDIEPHVYSEDVLEYVPYIQGPNGLEPNTSAIYDALEHWRQLFQ